MNRYRRSYFQTMIVAGLAAPIVVVSAHWVTSISTGLGSLALFCAWIAAGVLSIVFLAGCVVLHRDRCLWRGASDPFVQANRTRSEAAVLSNAPVPGLWWRRLLRAIIGSKELLVGEWVTIKSFDEIRATLDANGGLDGMPFQPEMLRFCGTRARVYRNLDKVYDYGGKKVVRRLRNAVLLAGLRCDGASHDGCQALCYLIWKDAWLRRDGADRRSSVQAPQSMQTAEAVAALDTAVGTTLGAPKVVDAHGVASYMCQYTEIVPASTPLSPRDVRQDLRPVLTGNITVKAASIGWLTRLFDLLQGLRRSVGYPYMVVAQANAAGASVDRALQPGDKVVVRSHTEIAQTLDKTGKNRGLWFDSDMVKHCNKEYVVLSRVERIIDDATRLMRFMKTPCIVLDGVNFSGEGLRFSCQEDPAFWREAWLKRTTSASRLEATPGQGADSGPP